MGRNRKEPYQEDTAPPSPVETEIEKIRAWAKRYAEKSGLVLNPDEKELNTVLRGLATNRARSGKQYCPCRLRSGDPEEDRKIICPCIYHREEIAKDGHCHCRLFFRPDPGGKGGTQ